MPGQAGRSVLCLVRLSVFTDTQGDPVSTFHVGTSLMTIFGPPYGQVCLPALTSGGACRHNLHYPSGRAQPPLSMPPRGNSLPVFSP